LIYVEKQKNFCRNHACPSPLKAKVPQKFSFIPDTGTPPTLFKKSDILDIIYSQIV
jgi:hypothetical protein